MGKRRKRNSKRDCVTKLRWIGVDLPSESVVPFMTSGVYLPNRCQQVKKKSINNLRHYCSTGDLF